MLRSSFTFTSRKVQKWDVPWACLSQKDACPSSPERHVQRHGALSNGVAAFYRVRRAWEAGWKGLNVRVKEWGAFAGKTSQQGIPCGRMWSLSSQPLFVSIRCLFLLVMGETHWVRQGRRCGEQRGHFQSLKTRIKKSLWPKRWNELGDWD